MNLWIEYNQPIEKSNTQETDKLTEKFNIQAQVLVSKELELTLVKETSNKMQQIFAEQHNKQRELERELNFYRSVVAPESSADGVFIDEINLTLSLLPRQYRLKLILTQLQKRKQSLKGKSSIILVGIQNKKIVELDLAQLLDDKELFDFNFIYFQIQEMEFTLPEGFELSRVKVSVKVPSSRWEKGSVANIEYSIEQLLPELVMSDTKANNNNPKEIDKNTLKYNEEKSDKDFISDILSEVSSSGARMHSVNAFEDNILNESQK
ncbi:hypothetical protein HQQ94_06790 [Shewanella sp. VB17]|uniref:DUF6776 family protein n=1 Tax=Shewanella sp. VB17 TaxID=2739432 RepID=UPI001C2736AB|nr:DUF6776 family protein [Shewanella sp. VB17]NRD72948.1 hypothetical protein [Shewanella sp. VB17]